MRSLFLRVLTFLIAVSLIASDPELFLRADRMPPEADGIFNQAVTPPLLAADFRQGFDAKKHRALNRQAEQALVSHAPQRALTASLREPWSSRVLAFPGARGNPSSRRFSPWRIDQLICTTFTEYEALRILEKEQGWSPTPTQLAKYMKRYGIHTSWRPYAGLENTLRGLEQRGKYDDRQRRPEVRRIILRAANLEEAIELLRKELRWALTPSQLLGYMNDQRLTAPHWKTAEGGTVVHELLLFLFIANVSLIVSIGQFGATAESAVLLTFLLIRPVSRGLHPSPRLPGTLFTAA